MKILTNPVALLQKVVINAGTASSKVGGLFPLLTHLTDAPAALSAIPDSRSAPRIDKMRSSVGLSAGKPIWDQAEKAQ